MHSIQMFDSPFEPKLYVKEIGVFADRYIYFLNYLMLHLLVLSYSSTSCLPEIMMIFLLLSFSCFELSWFVHGDWANGVPSEW